MLLAGVFFIGQQDYKNNVDKKVAAGIVDAEAQIATIKDAELAEKEKQPYAIYNGPATFGSVSLTYPKTWSAYVDENGTSKSPLLAYFHPTFVPGVDSGASIALTMSVTDLTYDKAVASYDSYVSKGDAVASPFSLEKTAGVTGLKITGKIARDTTGTVVLLPIRDKTLILITESNEFLNDFNNVILKNLTLVP